MFALVGWALTMPWVPCADEGMWLFNEPPREMLRQRHGFEMADEWMERVQRASVRFNSGGSGSFVSREGLVMSNHHVGADAIQKLSSAERNYLEEGFYARTQEEELRCLDLELNVLQEIEDVTDRVTAAVRVDASAEDAFAARRSVLAAIEKESLGRTGLRSDVVTLYQGGRYHLYRFKRYTDVRLVFAPEQQIAFFGGDPDNFEYPRYCLDVCFFRVYEDGRPARVEDYLPWSEAGTREGDLVFVSGHPGRTSRQLTVAETEYMRDVRLPFALRRLYRGEVLLSAYSARSEENARRAKEELLGVQNGRKALGGQQAGLLDPRLMEKKRVEERELRDWVAGRAAFEDVADAWRRIEAAQDIIGKQALRYNLLEAGLGLHSLLFDVARTVYRAAEEREKPNGERLREFSDSGRETLELGLYSEQPIYDDLERLKLADSLTMMSELLGAEDALVKRILGGQSPRERAAGLVGGSRLKEVSIRRAWYEGGRAMFEKEGDPMMELAAMVDKEARELRQIVETQGEIKQQAHAQIARARFALQGTGAYPDATFTLRLAFGLVKGYSEDGEKVPSHTTFEGLYERALLQKNRPPFELPERWVERKGALDLETPFNFVSTVDIIGGNSGSPVIDRKGELVGIIFDGNIHSLVFDMVYTEEQARSVSVDSRGIMAALRQVYGAERLVKEIMER
jgi:hypothetical protein